MRLPVYFFVGVLLLVLTLESVREISNFQRASSEQQYRLAQDTLEKIVGDWESKVMKTLEGWLKKAARHSFNETTLRRNAPWFDGFFVWEPGGQVLWPPQHVVEDPKAQRAPCILEAEANGEGLDRAAGARLLEACIGEDPLVSLVAASGAASEYLDAHDWMDAERVLSRVDLLIRGELTLMTARHLPIVRVVSLRHQAAQAEAQQGRTNYEISSLASDIGDLDTDALEAVMDIYSDILPEVMGPEADDMLARAHRRIDALHEIREHPWDADTIPDLDDSPPRLYLDPVGDPPYLLFYGRIGDGDRLAAIQVDQNILIQDLRNRFQEAGRYVSIRDPRGRVLEGAQGDLGPNMAFASVFPHLRIGITKQFLVDYARPTNLFAQTWPMLIGFGTGIGAMLALIRADRKQAELMQLQREFMARVTHELKTPIAGIRLMAENLETGAFKDTNQRQKYARQIIKESERLGQRVDEVLRAADRPSQETPTDVNLDVLLQEIYDRWKPLYEQQGASLIAELGKAGTVKTQRGLLRDALYNLLDNALKYRREDRPGRVILRMTVERRSILIDVEDNGMGVPAAMRKAIFERFRRVEGPGRGLAGGHGLGLYFVAEAARMLGGKVECVEAADGGARFLFRIPRSAKWIP